MGMMLEGKQKLSGELLRLKDNSKVSILSVISLLKFERRSIPTLIVLNGSRTKILRLTKNFGPKQTSS